MASKNQPVEPLIAQDILDDSGYRSRKYWAMYVYFALLSAVAGASINWTGSTTGAIRAASALALLLPYGGLLGAALSAYYGVNIGHAWVAKKATETEAKE